MATDDPNGPESNGGDAETNRFATSNPDADWIAAIKPSTARLFGAHIWRERQYERKLSAEVLLTGSNRTKEWLAAIESGDVVPTRQSLVRLEKAFRRQQIELDLMAHLVELELQPYGDLAEKARDFAKFGVASQTTGEEAPATTNPVPIVSSIRHQDRLLILAPILITLSLLTLTLSLVRASLTGSASVSLEVFLSASTAFLSLSIFFLDAADRVLAATARLFRIGRNRHHRTQAEKIRRNAGLSNWEPSVIWYHEADVKYLIPRHRDDYRFFGLRAELGERLLGPVALTSLVSTGAAISALALEGVSAWTVALVAYSLFLAITAKLIVTSCPPMIGAAVRALALGMGFDLQEKPDLDGVL